MRWTWRACSRAGARDSEPISSRRAERATHSCASSSDACRCSRRHRTTPSPSCAWRSRSTFGTSSRRSQPRRSSSIASATRSAPSRTRAGSRATSKARVTWSSPGENHLPFIDGDDILDEIQEFLTGVREPVAPDRMLATVLFTDVVGSTDRARELGDRRWRDLLERHNEVVRRDLERFRGVEIDTAGDGFFATFDGPARAIRCARSIVENVRGVGLDVRSGLHTGECELERWIGSGNRCPHGRARRLRCLSRRGARVEHREGSRRRIWNRVHRPRRARAQGDSGRVAVVRRKLTTSTATSATSVRSRASNTHESPASKSSESLK